MTTTDPVLADAIEACEEPAAFDALLSRWPDDPVALSAAAEAHESAGDLRTALRHYERALDAGLEGMDLRRCFLRTGDVLRRLGRLDESIAVLEHGLDEFPGSRSLRTFLALALHEQGRSDRALALVLQVLVDPLPSPDLVRWTPAIRDLATRLTARDD